MNQCLMDNYADTVRPCDDVILLGDIAFRNHAHFIGALAGHKTFVFGNHDRMPQDVLRNFTRVIGGKRSPGILEMNVGPQQVSFSHYPMASWNGSFHGTWNVHGHCHGRMPEYDTMLRVDAGVDVFDFKPVNFDVLMDKLNSRVPAWHERMHTLGMGETSAEFEKNRCVNRVFVERWRQRVKAQPEFYGTDYRTRYGHVKED